VEDVEALASLLDKLTSFIMGVASTIYVCFDQIQEFDGLSSSFFHCLILSNIS
jgi:hypothetical protein